MTGSAARIRRAAGSHGRRSLSPRCPLRPSRHRSGTTIESAASQPIRTSWSRTARERLVAELLDDEDLLADAHLVLDARAERILVVEAADDVVVGIAGRVEETEELRPHDQEAGAADSRSRRRRHDLAAGVAAA